MRDGFLRLADLLHRVTAGVCTLLLLVLFAAQTVVVLLRYVFGIGFLELQGVVSYSFALLAVLAIPIALRLDRHVRVDVIRRMQSPGTARRFDGVGILGFLAPLFILTLVYVFPDILYSWSIREGAIETGGLPGYFLVKTGLPLACVLMLVQGAALFAGASKPEGPSGERREP